MPNLRLALAAVVLALFAVACPTKDVRNQATPEPTPRPSLDPVASPDPEAMPAAPVAEAVKWLDIASLASLRPVPGGDGYLIVDRGGRVFRYAGSGRPEPILDIRPEVSTEAEEGLFDVVISPDGDKAYLHFTGTEKPYGDNHIREYGWDGNDFTGEGREVLVVEHPYPHHNGGQLQFGPDGYLYIAIGDGGTATLKQEEGNGDPHGYGRSPDDLLGNILRIDPTRDGDRGYTIPGDNPFVGKKGRDEIWAYGLRNPWRFSFDSETGDLWIADVGHRYQEEVNHEPSGFEGGRFYGWSAVEGNIPYKGEIPKNHTLPVFTYAHRDGLCAIVGGYVYRGSAIPSLAGSYVYGDFCTGELFAITMTDGEVTAHRSIGAKVPMLVSLAEDRDGELFGLSYSEGIFRLGARRAATS